jgi:peptide/nickel transport system permease protein
MPPLLRHVIARLITLILMLLGPDALCPGMSSGDRRVMLGGEGTPQQVAELRKQLGLDRPLPVRYWEWLTRVVRGDLGESLYNRTRVVDELIWRFPSTLSLVFLALLISILIGVPAGLLSAVFRNSWVDHVARVLTLVSLSMPSFWLGLMLIILFR